MGLDQYLYRGIDPVQQEVDFGNGKTFTYETRGQEVAYFRKVNFLHKWVEDHLNEGRETNCEYIPFHLEAMAGLTQTCATVIADPSLGPELLPTMGRFFFGSEAYDEYYLDDVRDVQAALVRILCDEQACETPGSGQYSYYSSW